MNELTLTHLTSTDSEKVCMCVRLCMACVCVYVWRFLIVSSLPPSVTLLLPPSLTLAHSLSLSLAPSRSLSLSPPLSRALAETPRIILAIGRVPCRRNCLIAVHVPPQHALSYFLGKRRRIGDPRRVKRLSCAAGIV